MEWLHTETSSSVFTETSHSSLRKFLHKVQKTLVVCASVRQRKSGSYRNDIGVSLVLGGIWTVQGLSLVFRTQDKVKGYSDFESFFTLLNCFRFDVLAVRLQWVTPFFILLLVGVYLPVVLLTVNLVLGLVCKRQPVSWTIRLMTALLALLREIMLIPFLVLMMSYLKYTFLYPNTSAMPEYFPSSTPLSSLPCALLSLFTFPTLLVELYCNATFLYENVFSKRKLRIYAMSHSLLPQIHLLFTFLLVLSYSFLSELREHWYRLSLCLLCLLLYLLTQHFLPYYNMVINARFAASQAVLVWGVITYYVGYWADSAGAMVALLVFVIPPIASLAYTHTKLSSEIGKIVNIRGVESLNQLDLKLRTLLEELESADKMGRAGIHQNIEDLLACAALKMGKSPLLPIWEANYYFYYRKDPFLATLKLTKSHITDKTLESGFYTLKSLSKFSSNEVSSVRLYLKYLMLMNQAQHLDESFCQTLLNLTAELLRAKPDAFKCQKLTSNLAQSSKKAVNKYFKLLELYPENTIVLRLLGSFLLDVMKEEAGRNYLFRAQMRRGSGYSHNSAFFSEKSGTLILSCALPSPGLISLADSKVCKVLGMAEGDLVGKEIVSVLPEDLARVGTEVLGKLVLLKYDMEPARQLLYIVLDSEGLIAPASISLDLTTWYNTPYLLMSLKEWSTPQIRLLIDPHWLILHHSSLSLFPYLPQAQYRYLHIHSLLPDFLQQYNREEEQLEYVGSEGMRWKVKVETLSVAKMELRVVTITKGDAMLSIPSSMGDQVARNDYDRKEVRFGAKTNIINTHSNISTIHSEPMDAERISETRAQIKRKMTFTSSIQSSVQGTKRQDIQTNHRIRLVSKRLSILLLLCFVITIADVGGSLIYMTKLLSSLEATDTLRAYLRRNELLVELAYDARSLLLADDPAYEYDSAAICENMKAEIAELNAIIDLMKQRVDTADPAEIRSKAITQAIPSWKLIAGHITYEQTSLLDGLMRMSLAALRLTSSQPPYMNSSDGFYVVRNAVGETLEELNKTLSVLTEKDQEDREEQLTIISILVIICFIIIIIPLLVLVAPQIYRLEQLQQELWTHLYTLPKEAVVSMRTTVQDRLQDTFTYEDYSGETVQIKENKASSKPTAVWITLVKKLSVYIVCTLVLLFVVQFSFAKSLGEVAVTIPNYTYWAGIRPQSIQEGSFWARELQLMSKSHLSYFDFVSSGSYWPHPLPRITNSTASLDFTARILDNGSSKYGIITPKKSDSYTSYLFQSACGALQDPACFDVASQYGARYMVKDWKSTVLSSIRTTIPAGEMGKWLRKLEKEKNWARNGAQMALTFYYSDSLILLDALAIQIECVCAVYMACVLLLYFLLYLPSIRSIRDHCLQSIFIHKVLSQDSK